MSEEMDRYQNDKLMDKRSPKKYTCGKIIEDVSKKVHIRLV